MGTNLILPILSAVLAIWLIVLTYFYFSSVRHYKKFTISGGESLEKAINSIFRGLEEIHTGLQAVEGRVSGIEEANKQHVQKVSLKRFNPFDDTGGNQSFSVAFLDANNNGVVFSSLHGRSGTRIYAKPVKDGKQHDYELSQEELEVIGLALEN